MNAFILVFSHPFFAITDAEGRYRIDNVPPGTYNVIAWNEGVSSEPRRGIATGGVAELDFTAPMNHLPPPQDRIFLTSALLAVLSIGVAIYIVNVRVTGRRARAERGDIGATGGLVDQPRTTRARRRSRHDGPGSSPTARSSRRPSTPTIRRRCRRC